MSKRNAFVVYHDWRNLIEGLSLEQKGLLLDAMFTYSCGESVEIKDTSLKGIFAFIKGTMDRDKAKYEATCQRNREIAKKHWECVKKEAEGIEGKKKNGKSGNKIMSALRRKS